MEHLSKIDLIITRLKESNNSSIANEVRELKLSASTGSELLMSVTHRLVHLIEEKPELKEIIGHDVDELRAYCFSIGLYIK